MLAIKIIDPAIRTIEGISPKNNKPYCMRSQKVLVKLGEEVRFIDITLRDKQDAYPVGNYQLDAEKILSFGKYGLEVDDRNIVLVRTQ